MCPVSGYIQGDQCALYLGIYKVISVPCIWVYTGGSVCPDLGIYKVISEPCILVYTR